MWLSNSSIGRKVVMSLTGLFLILFLTFHMCMNLVAIFSAEGYEFICEFLGANWYALLGTAVIAVGAILHIAYAFWLTMQNRRARGTDRYAVEARPKTVEWASQNMLVLGIIVFLGIALHLFQFWAKMQLVEVLGEEPASGIALIEETFKNPVFVLLYLVWFAAIWFHLTHGFWSAIQTLGVNNHVWFNRWKCASNVFATIICVGFAIVAIAFFFKGM